MELTVITAARHPDTALFAACTASLCTAATGIALQWVVVLDDSTPREPLEPSFTTARDHGIRVDVLELPFRAGAGGARTLGLTHCRSEWVAVLDADDLLPPDALRSQLAALRASPDAKWCVGAGETLDVVRTFHPHTLPAVVPAGYLAAATRTTGVMPTIPIAGIWRTNDVLRLGAWPSLPRDEDTSLKLALTSVSAGVSVPQSVYVYRRNVTGQATLSSVFDLSAQLCRASVVARLAALVAHGEAPRHVIDGDWGTFLRAGLLSVAPATPGTVDSMEMCNVAADSAGTVAACGPVSVSTNDLVDPRAFKHREHPLAKHADAFAAATGCGDSIWALRDSAWRNLVVSHVVPTLGVSVGLTDGSHNAAYARFVDGLTNNEDALQAADVLVPAEAIAAAFVAAAATVVETAHVPTTHAAVTHASTLTDGLTALIGRRVEVSFLGAVDELAGQVVAVHPDTLVVAANEMLRVVPLSAVAYVSTWQLTDDEDQVLLD